MKEKYRTVQIRKNTHERLKIESIKKDKDMGDLANEAILEWLKKRK